jgi:hypothetical protein
LPKSIIIIIIIIITREYIFSGFFNFFFLHTIRDEGAISIYIISSAMPFSDMSYIKGWIYKKKGRTCRKYMKFYIQCLYMYTYWCDKVDERHSLFFSSVWRIGFSYYNGRKSRRRRRPKSSDHIIKFHNKKKGPSFSYGINRGNGVYIYRILDIKERKERKKLDIGPNTARRDERAII